MCDLKEVFGDHIDYLNKYHFYPRLAKRAAEYISKQDDIQVLLEILEEVALIAYEWCSKFYFAYGSNMDQKQMLNRCPTAKCFGKAKIDNYRFIINARGVASIIPWEGSGVEGLVWCIFNQDEEQLDIYEGIVGGYYFKDTLVFKAENPKGPCNALVYIASNQKDGTPRPGYLEKIVKATEKI